MSSWKYVELIIEDKEISATIIGQTVKSDVLKTLNFIAIKFAID